MSNLLELCRSSTKANGFPVCGIVNLTPEVRDVYVAHSSRYESWLRKGYAADMEYLERGLDRRKDPNLVFPGVRSVLAVLLPYSTKPLGNQDPSRGPRFARYLRGDDYHKVVKSKLTAALEEVRTTFPDLEYKICVDTSAVLERTWGYLAGLGWIGKNTMFIHPKIGSYTFIGIAFLNQESPEQARPLKDLCGNCELCLGACPTNAFPQPRMMDSNRCISYLTIEKRGDSRNAVKDHQFGSWIAGCDVCQEVCPFNQKRTKSEAKEPEEKTWFDSTWQELSAMDQESYRSRIRSSSLSRIKFPDFRRNLSRSRVVR